MKRLSTEEYGAKFFDRSAVSGEKMTLYETQPGDCVLPKRDPHSHKYSYGRAAVVGGCAGFSGAPRLAANACERSGAGLTHALVPDSIYSIVASRCDGAVVTPLPSAENGAISRAASAEILPVLKNADACLIGPGLGRSADAEDLVTGLIRELCCPLVLDADALGVVGRRMELIEKYQGPVILTPHEGEFKRLGGELSAGRLAGALAFAVRYPNVILVLKGYGTLICSGREVAVNPTGSPAMAKGGSGDVLGGVLCALLAQGFEPVFAARTAVYLHGLAGDLAGRELGEYCVMPSDLISYLPAAFRLTAASGGENSAKEDRSASRVKQE